MQKVVRIFACASLVALMAGCASFWKTLGVATEKSVEERMEAVRKDIAVLTVKTDDARRAAENVAKLEAFVKELEARMDDLPADTLARIAELLAEAAEEARNAADAKDGGAAAPAGN